METWALIIYLYVNQVTKSSSGAVTSVSGFATIAECQRAGETAKSLTKKEDANLYYVCVSQTTKK